MYLNNQKGMAVPLVLVFMVVLMLLGTALMQFNTADAIQVARDQSKMQAHYLARSGTDATASWVLKNATPGQIDVMFPESISDNIGDLDKGEFKVRITGYSGGPMIIKSTGQTGDVSDVVSLTLKQMALFDNAIWARGNLNFTGTVDIYGSVESVGTVSIGGNASVTGDAVSNSIRDYPEPKFPGEEGSNIGALPVHSDIDVKNNDTLIITSSYKFNKITVRNGGTLIFAPPSNINIEVNEIDMKGTMQVVGSRVMLFINNDADFSGEVIAEPKNLIILLRAGSSIKLPGNAVFNGFIYGPNATINLNGTPGYNGAIIGNVVSTVGTTDVAYNAEGAENILPGDLPLGVSSLGYIKGYYQ